MFKVGQKVVFKYPERSAWSDTMAGIERGTLVLGGTYYVTFVGDISGYENSIKIHKDSPPPGGGYGWGLSAACCVPLGTNRKLPDWF